MTDRTPALPAVVDRATWQAERDALLAREKAHTRERDEIAAARRRLPMVEVDATITLIGPQGPVTLLEVFEGRRQLIAYYHMWYAGQPAADQCEGCTFYNGQVRELSYLHSRDVTYATFCQGPYEESVRYRDFMGWEMPWYTTADGFDTDETRIECRVSVHGSGLAVDYAIQYQARVEEEAARYAAFAT